MGRPKGSLNKPKGSTNAEKIEEMKERTTPAAKKKPGRPPKVAIAGATPVIGHNSSMTDDQKRALLFDAVGKIRPMKEKIASLTGELRNLYKTAKAEGVEKSWIDLALKLQGMDEPDVKILFEDRNRILRWTWPHLADQASLFDQPNRMPGVDRAYEEGKTAAMQGEPFRSPYDPSVPQGQEWQRGYHDGQAAHIEGGISKLPPGPPEDDDFDTVVPFRTGAA